jgi:hypothetical protein
MRGAEYIILLQGVRCFLGGVRMRRHILAILGLGSAVSGSFARREVFSRDMSACRGVFWV